MVRKKQELPALVLAAFEVADIAKNFKKRYRFMLRIFPLSENVQIFALYIYTALIQSLIYRQFC